MERKQSSAFSHSVTQITQRQYMALYVGVLIICPMIILLSSGENRNTPTQYLRTVYLPNDRRQALGVMAAKTFLYFGYGSNLLRERLLLANPSAVFNTVAKLTGYELVFLGQSGRWEGGVASIAQKAGREVWGVVWTMSMDDLPSLDKQEGIYTPLEVKVTDPQGQNFACRTYQLQLDWKPGLPSPHYKDVIARGARQNGLPDSYLQFLEGLPDNGFHGNVRVYSEVMKLIGEEGASPPSNKTPQSQEL